MNYKAPREDADNEEDEDDYSDDNDDDDNGNDDDDVCNRGKYVVPKDFVNFDESFQLCNLVLQ